MLTMFTTAKPFRAHIGMIQRNALRSWKMLDPGVEIIIFGEDEGAGEVARELGLRHEPVVERNAFGTILIDAMFARAQATARHELLCYANCDVIFMQDFGAAIRRVAAAYAEFLAIGRRWDVDIVDAIDFVDARWEEKIAERAALENRQATDWYIDYFVFTRGFFGTQIPPLAVGRAGWDNWMVWRGRQTGKPVVDISRVAAVVHQTHDYRHHPEGRQGIYNGEEAELNVRLAGGRVNFRRISDATHVARAGRIGRSRKRYWMEMQRAASSVARFVRYEMWNPVYFALLGVTRPVRNALGLRSNAARVAEKNVPRRPDRG